MTTLLEKVLEKISNLPEIEQNAIARWILEEIESDQKWSKKFAGSEDVLEKLALEALEEDQQGKTTRLDIKKL